MSIRKILVPIRGDGFGRYLLDHAFALAKRLDCHVEALFIDSDIASLVPAEILAGSSIKSVIDQAVSAHTRAERDRVRARFDEWCESVDVTALEPGVVPPSGISVSWEEQPGRQSTLVCDRGKLSDLIVVSRPDPESRLGLNTLQAALFCTGRPVLLAPYRNISTLAGHVAVAWNASTVAAKAVGMALPLLAAAERVTVLCGEKKQAGTGIGDDLVAYLAMHGIAADIRLFRKSGQDIGACLVGEATAAGADLLVTGAYGRSRRSETILGGATESLVWNVSLPILMAH